jgi:GT2 family glycosyltransferase
MVGCIVLNWNGWRDTIACLTTLQNQTAQPLEVFVVDNGSTDDSVSHLEQFIATAEGETRFQLVCHPNNVGFGSGVNIGIRAAMERNVEFLWLLNNDTVCPPDTLEKLLRKAARNPTAGVVGTVLYYYDEPARVQAWGGGFISRWTGTSRHYLAPAQQVPGSYSTFACVLIRAEVFRQVGLLYQGFFMYYDDADFCLRMGEQTNWQIAVAEDTAVLHRESASTEGRRDPFMEKTIVASALRFLKRHSPLPLISLPLLVLIKLANRARRREWAACRAVLRGVEEYRSKSMAWTDGLSSDQTVVLPQRTKRR